jgi:hypothetical protein
VALANVRFLDQEFCGFIVATNNSADRPEFSQQIPRNFLTATLENTYLPACIICSESNPKGRSPISSLNSVKQCVQRLTITGLPEDFKTCLML